jgi:hypothetical protein
MRTSRLRCAFPLVLLFVLSAWWPAPLEAAILTVTDCGDNGGPTQIRQVIAAAQAGDTVLLPACSIVLRGTLTLAQNMSLSGAGAGVTVLSGGNVAAVLVINVGVTANLTGLSIQDGNAASGGGMTNFGTTVLANAVVSGNTAATHAGIDNQSGANLVLLNSAVIGNVSQQNGGGIGNLGSLTLLNSTVSGNSARGLGGGIRNEAALNLSNATIASNSGGSGGGIFGGTGGTVALKNTIVANNTAAIGANCQVLGPLNSGGHNLESAATCALTKTGDLRNRNPLLGALQDNGGRTPTQALLPGSPAIDAGDSVGCPATDQRGILRPQHGQCDIGAFEAESAFASGSFSISPPSGSYASRQSFDLVLLVNPLGRSITRTQAVFDGVDQSAALAACAIPGTLQSGGVTFRCPNIEGALFAPGTHVLTAAVTLDDGSTMSDTVEWEIFANSEP